VFVTVDPPRTANDPAVPKIDARAGAYKPIRAKLATENKGGFFIIKFTYKKAARLKPSQLDPQS
jgi:hypothetical protein